MLQRKLKTNRLLLKAAEKRVRRDEVDLANRTRAISRKSTMPVVAATHDQEPQMGIPQVHRDGMSLEYTGRDSARLEGNSDVVGAVNDELSISHGEKEAGALQ